MKYDVDPDFPKQFCYDVHTFDIEREVLQKNIERYRHNPLKKFKLDTIYLLATMYPDYYKWFYFVIIPVGSGYRVGILPLFYDVDNEPDTKSKYVTFTRQNIDYYGLGISFENLDYNTVLKSMRYLNASKGSERIIFPLQPSQEFLFMNWKENPLEVK